MVLPLSAAATLLGGPSDPGVEVTAAGPASRPGPASMPDVMGDLPGELMATTVVDGSRPPAGAVASAVTTEEAPTPPGGLPPTTTAEAPGRATSVDGSAAPRTAASVPPADDPVVRTPPSGSSPASTGTSIGSGGASGSAIPMPPTPAPEPEVAACPAADVGVTVTTEKSTYAAGETVRGSSTLTNRSEVTCLLPTRAFFRIEDGAGRVVGSFAYTMEHRIPVKAEPGKTFTSGLTWDQTDCSGSSCAQVPAGTYVAVADWNEGGPYVGRGTFRIVP